MMPAQPTYDLARVRELIGVPSRRIIRGSAVKGAGELGLDEDAVIECVRTLDLGCFYKTMPAEKCPGLWQDVYHPTFAGYALYVKVQVVEAEPNEMLVVISFKRR